MPAIGILYPNYLFYNDLQSDLLSHSIKATSNNPLPRAKSIAELYL
jgi:hypothetical protein